MPSPSTSTDLRDAENIVPFKAVQTEDADFFSIFTMILSSLAIVLRIPLIAWGSCLFAVASYAHRRKTTQQANPLSSALFGIMSLVMSYYVPARLKAGAA
ncbi:hypothetical protein RCL1_005589 [Eukaryota sp. TZLM3-RCL]